MYFIESSSQNGSAISRLFFRRIESCLHLQALSFKFSQSNEDCAFSVFQRPGQQGVSTFNLEQARLAITKAGKTILLFIFIKYKLIHIADHHAKTVGVSDCNNVCCTEPT